MNARETYKEFFRQIDIIVAQHTTKRLGHKGEKHFHYSESLSMASEQYSTLVQTTLDQLMLETLPKPMKLLAFYKDVEILRVLESETYSQRKIKLKPEDIALASKNLASFELIGEQAEWPRYQIKLEKENFEVDYYYRIPIKRRTHYAVYKNKNVADISCPKHTFFDTNPYFETVNKKNKQVPEIRTNNKEKYRYKMIPAGTWEGCRRNVRGEVSNFSETLWQKIIVERLK